jgi:hypothetical protein
MTLVPFRWSVFGPDSSFTCSSPLSVTLVFERLSV